jgi:hypothetical protein
MSEQHRQGKHNVTLRHVRVTTVALEKQLSMTKDECVYSCLGYPACKSHLSWAVLYCHLWPVWLHHIDPDYLTSGRIFGGEKINRTKKCVLISATTFVRNISHSEKNSARYYHKYTQVLLYSTRNSCPILVKLEF